jgi:multicomponent Na+:H+ antiporter subunit D
MNVQDFLALHGRDIAVIAPLTLGALLTILPQARLAAVLAAICGVALGALGASLLMLTARDPLGAGALMLMGVIAATAFIAAGPLFEREFERRLQPVALGLALMVTGAAIAAATAQDVLTIALAATGAGLAAAALTLLAVARERAAASAALTMIIATLGAGALALSGAGLLAAGGGANDLASLQLALSSNGDAGLLGAALLLAALAALAGLAPLNGWTADSAALTPHGGAPVVMILARIGALVAFARVFGLTQAAHLSMTAQGIAYGVAGLGALCICAGSIQAIGARDTRRLAAHALTAQFGCALIGLAAGGVDGAMAALFVIAAGAMTALALVVGAAAARPQLGATAPLSSLDGLARQRPFVAAAVGVAAFGLTGAPLTAAFLGKWLSVEAAIERGWYWAAIAIVAASFAAVFVAGQIIERMYFRQRSAQLGPAPTGMLSLAPALAAAALATLVFGWNGAAPLEAAREAARDITGAP